MTIMHLYERNLKENSKDYAYRVLKDNIMSLQLVPGYMLSESNLAEKLDISRTPIREVLMRLKNENLIEVKPQAGTFVSLLDEALIDDAIFMRKTLEAAILKEICNNRSEALIDELDNNVVLQRKELKLLANDSHNELAFHRLDKEFHRILFASANKINIWESILSLSTHYNRMRQIDEMSKNISKIVAQHEKLISIIRNKEIDEVEDWVYSHIVEPSKQWASLKENNPGILKYFKV